MCCIIRPQSNFPCSQGQCWDEFNIGLVTIRAYVYLILFDSLMSELAAIYCSLTFDLILPPPLQLLLTSITSITVWLRPWYFRVVWSGDVVTVVVVANLKSKPLNIAHVSRTMSNATPKTLLVISRYVLIWFPVTITVDASAAFYVKFSRCYLFV